MRVAVNFPYFVPYAGYFRLFTSVDVFVSFDCVPFPRRGFVHRNRLPDARGDSGWLTLPVRHAARDCPIRDMRLATDADRRMRTAARRFPVLDGPAAADDPLARACLAPGDGNRLLDTVETTLDLAGRRLGIPHVRVRSSELDIDPALRGEARVLEIVRRVGGTEYVNAPGGRKLYDREHFRRHGIALRFLEPYRGPEWSILYRLLTEPADALRREILAQGLPRRARY